MQPTLTYFRSGRREVSLAGSRKKGIFKYLGSSPFHQARKQTNRQTNKETKVKKQILAKCKVQLATNNFTIIVQQIQHSYQQVRTTYAARTHPHTHSRTHISIHKSGRDRSILLREYLVPIAAICRKGQSVRLNSSGLRPCCEMTYVQRRPPRK